MSVELISVGFLEDGIEFKMNAVIENDGLAEKIYSYLNITTERNPFLTYQCFLHIVGNLVMAASLNRPTIVSLNRNCYHSRAMEQYGYEWFSYKRFLSVIDSLLSRGFIEIKKGFRDREMAVSRMSRIWATKSLMDFFYAPKVIFEPISEPIQLKDEFKRLIPYRDNDYIYAIRNDLVDYLNFLSWHKIQFTVNLNDISQDKLDRIDVLLKLGHIRVVGKNPYPDIPDIKSTDSSISDSYTLSTQSVGSTHSTLSTITKQPSSTRRGVQEGSI